MGVQLMQGKILSYVEHLYFDRYDYLFGLDYTDIRLLSLHRFFEANLTDMPSKLPADFDLDVYIQSGYVDFLIGGRHRP